METQRKNGALRLSGIRELSAANARSFRLSVGAMLLPGLETIEIDLSQTRSVDACGLGALVSLYKTAVENRDGVIIRLVDPAPAVRQMIELTRMHHLFEIKFSQDESQNTAYLKSSHETGSVPVHFH